MSTRVPARGIYLHRLREGVRSAAVQDGGAAVMWLVVTVPPSFGFWVVAGDLAGVNAGQLKLLIAASLLGIGIATLLQVMAGYRLPVFEGPASTYLAAVAVIHASGGTVHPRAVTGGLLAAAALVILLGAVRADRIIKRLFTPAVVAAFVVMVVIIVMPDTLQRVIGRSAAHPFGSGAAWISAVIVIGVALAGQRLRLLRAYSLLAALFCGCLAYFVVAGFPQHAVDAAWTTPSVFPWGAPEMTLATAAPFLVAGLLASFNTIASINVMAELVHQPARSSQERRGLTAHGAGQCLTACFGNVLGHVPRLDSVGVVRLLGNPRPRALALAAIAMIGLAFLSPLVDVLARIPVPVSAALLAFVLVILLIQGFRQARALEPRTRWLVFVPAILPTFVWLPVAGSLSRTLQLVTNPLLIGVVLGVVLDRVARRPADIHRGRTAGT